MRSNLRNDGFFSGMPLFFKLWFGFVFTIVISIFIFVGYTIFSVASDPAGTAREMGALVGEMQKGYEDAAKPAPTETPKTDDTAAAAVAGIVGQM